MPYYANILLLSSVFAFTFQSNLPAQISGLWLVAEVKVGEETLTPIAKWFELDEEGNYRSGNGWLQNMAGSFLYDAQAQTVNQTVNGKPDEYGPFSIHLQEENMTWTRTEEGQLVVVSLKKTNILPRAPWDLLPGNWTLEKVEYLGKEVSQKYFEVAPELFFRWDRLFFVRGEVSLLTSGIWYIHPHRPELRLISQQGDERDTQWTLSFVDNNDQKMTWTRNVGDNLETWTFNKS